jgi:hypothetical protein
MTTHTQLLVYVNLVLMYCTTQHGAVTETCVSAQCAAICNALWLATMRYSPYDTSSSIQSAAAELVSML